MSKRTPQHPVHPTPTMLRQGDVLLVAVPSVPIGATPKPRDHDRVILAYGEATGHAHAITEPAVALCAFDDAVAMGEAARALLASVGLRTEIRDEEVVGFLSVGEDAAVRHEEHAPIPLSTGSAFVVLRQRQYTPERLQTVAD